MPYGWHDGGWGILWMVGSWALLIGIVVWLVHVFDRGPSPASRDATSPPDAESVLEERFARGEITEEEFVDRRRVLQGH